MLMHKLTYPSVHNTRSWNRVVPLYTEVSSIRRVRIERFHCIQRCVLNIGERFH